MILLTYLIDHNSRFGMLADKIVDIDKTSEKLTRTHVSYCSKLLDSRRGSSGHPTTTL